MKTEKKVVVGVLIAIALVVCRSELLFGSAVTRGAGKIVQTAGRTASRAVTTQVRPGSSGSAAEPTETPTQTTGAGPSGSAAQVTEPGAIAFGSSADPLYQAPEYATQQITPWGSPKRQTAGQWFLGLAPELQEQFLDQENVRGEFFDDAYRALRNDVMQQLPIEKIITLKPAVREKLIPKTPKKKKPAKKAPTEEEIKRQQELGKQLAQHEGFLRVPPTQETQETEAARLAREARDREMEAREAEETRRLQEQQAAEVEREEQAELVSEQARIAAERAAKERAEKAQELTELMGEKDYPEEVATTPKKPTPTKTPTKKPARKKKRAPVKPATPDVSQAQEMAEAARLEEVAAAQQELATALAEQEAQEIKEREEKRMQAERLEREQKELEAQQKQAEEDKRLAEEQAAQAEAERLTQEREEKRKQQEEAERKAQQEKEEKATQQDIKDIAKAAGVGGAVTAAYLLGQQALEETERQAKEKAEREAKEKADKQAQEQEAQAKAERRERARARREEERRAQEFARSRMGGESLYSGDSGPFIIPEGEPSPKTYELLPGREVSRDYPAPQTKKLRPSKEQQARPDVSKPQPKVEVPSRSQPKKKEEYKPALPSIKEEETEEEIEERAAQERERLEAERAAKERAEQAAARAKAQELADLMREKDSSQEVERLARERQEREQKEQAQRKQEQLERERLEKERAIQQAAKDVMGVIQQNYKRAHDVARGRSKDRTFTHITTVAPRSLDAQDQRDFNALREQYNALAGESNISKRLNGMKTAGSKLQAFWTKLVGQPYMTQVVKGTVQVG